MTKEFARLARKVKVRESELCDAIARAERGLIDAPLGKFLIKQRVARKNEGRSRGFRAIIFHMQNDRAILLDLFAKNEKASLTPHEEDTYREFAKILAVITSEKIAALLREKAWIEIDYEEYRKKISK